MEQSTESTEPSELTSELSSELSPNLTIPENLEKLEELTNSEAMQHKQEENIHLQLIDSHENSPRYDSITQY